MKLSWLSLVLIPTFILAECTPPNPTMQPVRETQPPPITIPAATASTIYLSTLTPTGIVKLPTDTPSPTATLVPIDTLEPAQVTETLQPVIKDPMNCEVPCFWGIVPGKTHLDAVRTFFSRLGFTTREGEGFYSAGYKSDSGDGFSTIFYTSGAVIENIEVTPYITRQKEGNPREWIAYSPETLIKRYGSPSDVRFTVSSYGVPGLPMNIGINMIMYFDTSDLIVHYDGYGMNPDQFCPLTAPFDFVRLWIGPNPPNPPSFETIPLEKATSLTMKQFTQLMLENPKKACFRVNGDAGQ